MNRFIIIVLMLLTSSSAIGQERITDLHLGNEAGFYRGWYEYEDKIYFAISHQSIHRVFEISNDRLELVFEFKMRSPEPLNHSFGFQEDYYFIRHDDQIVIYDLKLSTPKVYDLSKEDAYTRSEHIIFSYFGVNYGADHTTNSITRNGHLYHSTIHDSPEVLVYRDYETGRRDTLITGNLRDSVTYSMVSDSFLILGLKTKDRYHTDLWLYDLNASTKELIHKNIPYFRTFDKNKNQFEDLIYHDSENDSLFHFSFDNGRHLLYTENDSNNYIYEYQRKKDNSGYQVLVAKPDDKFALISINKSYQITGSIQFTYDGYINEAIDLEDYILVKGRDNHIYDKKSQKISKVELFPSTINNKRRSFATDSFHYKYYDNTLYIYNFYSNKLDSVTYPDLNIGFDYRVMVGNEFYLPAFNDSLFDMTFIKINNSKISEVSFRTKKFSYGISGRVSYLSNRLLKADSSIFLIAQGNIFEYQNGSFHKFIDVENVHSFISYKDTKILLAGPAPIVYTLKENGQNSYDITHIDTVETPNDLTFLFGHGASRQYVLGNKIYFQNSIVGGIPLEYDIKTKKANYLEDYTKRYFSRIIKNISDKKLLILYQDSTNNEHISTYNSVTKENLIPTKNIIQLNPNNYFYKNGLFASVYKSNSFDTYEISLKDGSYKLVNSIEYDEVYDISTQPRFLKYYKTNVLYKVDNRYYFSFIEDSTHSFETVQLEIDCDSIKFASAQFYNRHRSLHNLFVHGNNDKGYLIFNLYDSLVIQVFDMNNEEFKYYHPRKILSMKDHYITSIEHYKPKIIKYKDKSSTEIRLNYLKEDEKIDLIEESNTGEAFIAILSTEDEGEELWLYQDETFTPLTSINPGYYGSDPRNFIRYDNTIFFTAYSLDHGYQVYKYELPKVTSIKGNQIVKPLEFKIYPNPTIDELQLLSEDEIVSYEIFDLSGKLILKNHVTPFPISGKIDISELTAGNYIVKAKTKNNKVGAQIFVKPK